MIEEICKEYGIENYTINSDGTIDVVGDINLSNRRLTKLPLKFRSVTGDFYCDNNQLTSLEGAPQSVGGSFYCHDNQLTTLEGAPKSVGGNFYCNDNQLTSLEGAPLSIGDSFYCDIYLFEEMIDKTKPILKTRKSWRNEYIKKYKDYFDDVYFIAIIRDERLRELGI